MGLSRNKVAVPEGAAGSPPFSGAFGSSGSPGESIVLNTVVKNDTVEVDVDLGEPGFLDEGATVNDSPRLHRAGPSATSRNCYWDP